MNTATADTKPAPPPPLRLSKRQKKAATAAALCQLDAACMCLPQAAAMNRAGRLINRRRVAIAERKRIAAKILHGMRGRG